MFRRRLPLQKPARRGGARRAASLFAAALLATALVACGSDEPEYVEYSVEELYNQAMNDIQANRYAAAAKSFDEVERQHPYSFWATRAQLMSAYAYYQDNSYDDAVLAAQRFIRLHPGSRDVDYAYYLIAISYYEQISDVSRDQKMTEQAVEALTELVRRFPETEYARDAVLKLDLTYDHLAGKEMTIGRYYLDRKQYLAAIKRFQTVIELFQTTSHVPEALHRLTESYLALGVTDEAQATAAVLGYNYPGSSWYRDSYALLIERDLAPEESGRSWISRAWSAVF
jgi:outer membrane protein assembly factor BamD